MNLRIIEHPQENKPMQCRCYHCTALLEFTVAEVTRIEDASYITCPVCALVITIRDALVF
jgi:hypothetical protein